MVWSQRRTYSPCFPSWPRFWRHVEDLLNIFSVTKTGHHQTKNLAFHQQVYRRVSRSRRS
jgi:hypothetical protein